MFAHCTAWPAAPFPTLSMAPVATTTFAWALYTAATCARHVPATDEVLGCAPPVSTLTSGASA